MIDKKEPSRESLESSPPETDDAMDDSEELNEEEIDSLNVQMDQINKALDNLEQRNDDLQAKLVELLEVNKQAREDFLQIRTQTPDQTHSKGNDA